MADLSREVLPARQAPEPPDVVGRIPWWFWAIGLAFNAWFLSYINHL